MSGLTITGKIDLGSRRKRNAVEPEPGGRIPRVARLTALAIHIEQLIGDGEIHDYAEVARVGHVTRARVAQIRNLTNLAADIQTEILFMPPVTQGRDPISERDLRPIAAELNWRKQREMWRRLKDEHVD